MLLGRITPALFLAAVTLHGAAPPEQRFLASDWTTVYQAQFQLESAGAAALPKLMPLLDRPEIVKLTDTADLIYPGASTFYGHGWIIDYDLDRLATRAGWALEELTFENFGFSEGQINEADLPGTLDQGQSSVPFRNVIRRGRPDPAARLKRAVDRAKAWYAMSGSRWSRYQGLKAALESNDAFRQMKALSWLRHGITPCIGLSVETYARDLVPLVKRLRRSADQAVREQAVSLLADKENSWWRTKTDPRFRKWADPSAK
jgi:hypothetical protein